VKKLFEFKCTKCSHIEEEYTEYKKESICPLCNSVADKIISAPRITLEGYSGDFPGAAMQFDKKHRDKLKQELKTSQES
jgi:putative FmdB family regulatory protein